MKFNKIEFLERVMQSIERLLPQMPRAGIIRDALQGQGALIQVRDLDELLEPMYVDKLIVQM